MVFKVAVFLLIVLLIAVLSVRGYRKAIRRFDDEAAVRAAAESCATPAKTDSACERERQP